MSSALDGQHRARFFFSAARFLGRQLLKFEDRFDEIRNELQYLQNYLKDVERVKRRDRTETLKQVMTDVRELIHDVEEIIADYQLLYQKKKQGWAYCSLSPALSKSRYHLGKNLKDVHKRIKNVNEKMNSYWATVPTHGRNEVGEDIPFDELLKKMLKKLGVAAELLREKGVDDLLEDLKNKLDGEFLIILDDVWRLNEGQWWESLSSALPNVKGGCVMVTTRNEEVARSMGAIDEHIYHAEILSEENSWSLFCKVAFERTGGNCPNAEFEMHGKDIVAQQSGGVMMGKGYSINEWERISKHLKEEMTDSKKDGVVISRLELSYEELPMHLRPCLLCFAVYPEDYELESTRLIGTWIAEGFVWGRRGKTALQIGEECLNELRNRFLILTDEEYVDELSCYKVHDAVREILIEIAREESFFSMHHRDKLSRRGIIYENMPQAIIENNNSSRLRTLLVVVDTETVPPILKANLHKFQRKPHLNLPLVRLSLLPGL
ncbi:hypothetical protein ACLOJK_041011 [Asimina triloba]